MKVGILTFHRAENFGATLQAYALLQFLLYEGHEAKLIDYRCPAIDINYDIWNPRVLISRKNIFATLKVYIKRFFNLRDRKIRKEKYRTFWSKYYVTTKMFSQINSDLGFDAYITGSDQVWNLHLTGGIDKIFFLSFPMKVGAKKISYAASSENDPKGLLWQSRDKIKFLLSTFDRISVREEFLKKELSRYIDLSIKVCVDPTFLLKACDYQKILTKPSVNKHYVLVYHMTYSNESVWLAERIASKYGLQIIEVFGGYNRKTPASRYKCDLGPSEILGYISDADYVVTTSFHGLALSLILNKEFWIINHDGNYRQKNLLSLLGLEKRLVTDGLYCDFSDKVDYNEVNTKLNEISFKSKQFLQESLR